MNALDRHAHSELTLIQAIRDRTKPDSGGVRLGIGDDCALLRPAPGEEIAITTDFSLENVHFRRDWHTPESAGHRCLARGLSDLAAMGARPIAAFLSLALPAELLRSGSGGSWVERFLNGLLALADRMEVPLAGGDTAESPRVGDSALAAADIVLVGGIQRGRALLRSGARVGDLIYVTGMLGGGAAELLALGRDSQRFRGAWKAKSGHPHLFPEPRIAAGRELVRRRLATSAIDLSDGLSTDLRHICDESGLSAEIDAEAVPVHPMAMLAEKAGWADLALGLAMHGGEDYELLFTAPAEAKVPEKLAGVPTRVIGKMRTRRGERATVEIVSADGKRVELMSAGWEHFRH